MDPLEEDTTVDHSNHDAQVTNLTFQGESDALAKLLREHVTLLQHPEPHARRAALAGIASHLDLTRRIETREQVVDVLKGRLWKEDEPWLVQSAVKVLVDVALVPLCAGGKGVESVDVDGLVSSTSSPLKRPGGDAGGENVAVVRSVAQVLQGFLDGVGLGLQSAVRVQVLHSLVRIGERSHGVVTWESLGFAVRRHLRSSDARVRAVVLRLLAGSVQERGVRGGGVEGAKRRRVVGAAGEGEVLAIGTKAAKSDEDQDVVGGGVAGSRFKAGEMLLSSLVSYMKDPYPSVRETALRALMKLHGKGYELTSECCKNAAGLFRDSFEYVRIAAIEMVGLWMRSHLDVKDQSSLKQRTDAFLQVCTTVTDMNMRVREAAFRVLGEATRIPESVLLQTLTKKVAKAPKETDVSSSAPTFAAKEGDTGSPKFEEGANLLDASAAGAFVHGLEDEYLEVRCAAIEALAKLACKCERMVFGAANLLLDMLNEEVEVVRMQAMHALSQLATAGYLSVHDQHLYLFLSVVEDVSPEMRTGGRNLLASSLLPSFSTFHSIVRALLTSLERHPEDEEGVISTFSVLGQIRPTYTECITQELLQEMQGYLNDEIGLDEPRFAAILSLFLGAGLSNPNILSLIPARFLSYATFISHKLPDSLPLIKLRPIGLKSVQFSWSNREKRQMSAQVGAGRRALHISNPVAR